MNNLDKAKRKLSAPQFCLKCGKIIDGLKNDIS